MSHFEPTPGHSATAPGRISLALLKMSTRLDPHALRRARLRLGLTQEQLAQQVGAGGHNRISEWERGKSSPHPRHLLMLASALGMHPRQLLAPTPAGSLDLRRMRIEAGLSTVELSRLVNVSVPTLKRWESGQVRNLSQRAPVAALSRALDTPQGEIIRALEQSSRTETP